MADESEKKLLLTPKQLAEYILKTPPMSEELLKSLMEGGKGGIDFGPWPPPLASPSEPLSTTSASTYGTYTSGPVWTSTAPKWGDEIMKIFEPEMRERMLGKFEMEAGRISDDYASQLAAGVLTRFVLIVHQNHGPSLPPKLQVETFSHPDGSVSFLIRDEKTAEFIAAIEHINVELSRSANEAMTQLFPLIDKLAEVFAEVGKAAILNAETMAISFARAGMFVDYDTAKAEAMAEAKVADNPDTEYTLISAPDGCAYGVGLAWTRAGIEFALKSGGLCVGIVFKETSTGDTLEVVKADDKFAMKRTKHEAEKGV